MSAESDPSPEKASRWRRWRGSWWILWVVVVTFVMTPLLSSSQHELGPGTVAVSVRPALRGAMVLSFPPLGRVSAPTHRGPSRVTVELREIDVQPLLADGGRVDLETLTGSVREDIGPALRSIVLRLALVGALLGAVAVLVLPGRRVRRVVAGAAIGSLTAVSVAVVSLVGFDPTRFDEPTYEGPLASGGSILAAVASGDRSGLDARLDVLAARVADLYSSGLTTEIAGSGGDVSILHVSDLHLNPVGVGLARQLADSFEVDAVLDTGDTTSFGLPPEEAFAQLFSDFGVPYYFVAGNHDSEANRSALSSAEGVTAIGGRVVEVEGVRILGFDDPVVTSTREIDVVERRELMQDAAPELQALVERNDPDVVAMHNPAMASAVAGEVPVVVAGHLHENVLSAEDGTVIAVVGSTGATGLGSLTVEADLPYHAQILRFRDAELVAIDTIELTGTNGDFSVTRRLVTEELLLEDPDEKLDSDPDEGGEAPPGTEAPVTTDEVPATTDQSEAPDDAPD